jgi:hypothetical protein
MRLGSSKHLPDQPARISNASSQLSKPQWYLGQHVRVRRMLDSSNTHLGEQVVQLRLRHIAIQITNIKRGVGRRGRRSRGGRSWGSRLLGNCGYWGSCGSGHSNLLFLFVAYAFYDFYAPRCAGRLRGVISELSCSRRRRGSDTVPIQDCSDRVISVLREEGERRA